MLNITRRIGESLVIGLGREQSIITVMGTYGRQVELAVLARRHVPVDRLELCRKSNPRTALSWQWDEHGLISPLPLTAQDNPHRKGKTA